MTTINGYPESILDDPKNEAWESILKCSIDYETWADIQGCICIKYYLNGVGYHYTRYTGCSAIRMPPEIKLSYQLQFIEELARVIRRHVKQYGNEEIELTPNKTTAHDYFSRDDSFISGPVHN